jgi:hypothetical protein
MASFSEKLPAGGIHEIRAPAGRGIEIRLLHPPVAGSSARDVSRAAVACGVILDPSQLQSQGPA